LIRLLVKDDEIKRKSCENLLEKAKRKEIILYILPVAILEIVWILEKYYRLNKITVREHVEAILIHRSLIVKWKKYSERLLRFMKKRI